MQKGGAGWLGRGGRSGPGPVTRGPESRQGGRGEEKVGDAATVHGGASPAERPGQTRGDRQAAGRRDRQGSVGWALRPGPPILPPAALSTHGQRTLPPAASSSLCASITTHSTPGPPSPLLPPACSLTLAGAPPPPTPCCAGSAAAFSPAALLRLTSQPSLRLCPSLWPSQICLALNLVPTPRPAQQTPGLAHLAPQQPPAFICQPRAGQTRPARPAPCRKAPTAAPPQPAAQTSDPCHVHQRPHPSDTPFPSDLPPLPNSTPQTPFPLDLPPPEIAPLDTPLLRSPPQIDLPSNIPPNSSPQTGFILGYISPQHSPPQTLLPFRSTPQTVPLKHPFLLRHMTPQKPLPLWICLLPQTAPCRPPFPPWIWPPSDPYSFRYPIPLRHSLPSPPVSQNLYILPALPHRCPLSRTPPNIQPSDICSSQTPTPQTHLPPQTPQPLTAPPLETPSQRKHFPQTP